MSKFIEAFGITLSTSILGLSAPLFFFYYLFIFVIVGSLMSLYFIPRKKIKYHLKTLGISFGVGFLLGWVTAPLFPTCYLIGSLSACLMNIFLNKKSNLMKIV